MKQEYNHYLERYKNMEEWNKTATVKERYKYTDLAVSITRRLAYLWNKIEDKEEYNLLKGF